VANRSARWLARIEHRRQSGGYRRPTSADAGTRSRLDLRVVGKLPSLVGHMARRRESEAARKSSLADALVLDALGPYLTQGGEG
jgi:hypothetical protein